MTYPSDIFSPGQPFTGPAPNPLTPEALVSMVHFAARQDWVAYIELAQACGVFSPEIPNTTLSADSHAHRHLAPWTRGGSGYHDAFTKGMTDALDQGVGAFDFLTKAAQSIPPTFMRDRVLSTLMCREIDASIPEQMGRDTLEAVLALGADPLQPDSEPALFAARSGSVQALRSMLHAGLDPNAWPQGSLPLLLAALSKERAYTMIDKMACAKMLWEAGARFTPIFHGLQEPSSLLELEMMTASYGAPVGLLHSPLLEFDFPYNYFDESGIPATALLPLPDDRAGRERLGKILDSVSTDMMEDDYTIHTNTPSLSGDDWRRRATNYPWLAQALDALAAAREHDALHESTPAALSTRCGRSL